MGMEREGLDATRRRNGVAPELIDRLSQAIAASRSETMSTAGSHVETLRAAIDFIIAAEADFERANRENTLLRDVIRDLIKTLERGDTATAIEALKIALGEPSVR